MEPQWPNMGKPTFNTLKETPLLDNYISQSSQYWYQIKKYETIGIFLYIQPEKVEGHFRYWTFPYLHHDGSFHSVTNVKLFSYCSIDDSDCDKSGTVVTFDTSGLFYIHRGLQ